VLAPGLLGEITATVTDGDTARALGSGEVQVLATPRVVALVEAATLAALADGLDDDTTTVGTRVELDHLAPSPVGAQVTATAELTEVSGRRLTFDVSLRSGPETLARGRVTRAVVARSRFP
jgi:fluoroacetyl-CoA thioesterase